MDDASLIGREHELARLADFLTDLPLVGGALVLLGEPGVGKTALLAAAAREADKTGMRVLRTAGVQYRAEASYGALRQLLTATPETREGAARNPALAAALGHVRAAPSPNRAADPGTDGGTGHEALADAVVSLLAEGLGDRPTLLILDDAQWLDRASADILAQVARRLLGSRIGMVSAARAGEESFFDHSGLALHEVGPLSEAASEALLARRFPALAARVRRRLMADAEETRWRCWSFRPPSPARSRPRPRHCPGACR